MRHLILFPAILLVLFSSCDSTPDISAKDLLLKADSLLTVGKPEEAIKVIEEAHEVDSSDYRGWYMLGEAYHAMDDCDAALEFYLRAQRMNRNDAIIVRNQGICRLAKGKYELALEDFNTVIASPSVVIQDYYYRATCEVNLEMWDAGYEDIMNAIQIDTADLYKDRFMGFIYDNFPEDYLTDRFYLDRGMKVTYTYDADSVKNGQWTSVFSDGTVYEKGTYKDGVKSGKEELFYQNGQLQSVVNFEEGKMSGVRTTYFESGRKWSEVPYVNNLREGQALSWYEDGKLHKREQYKEGRKNTIQYEYDPTGRIVVCAEYVMGLEHGYVYVYNMEKEVYTRLTFDNGAQMAMDEMPEDFDSSLLEPS